MLILILPQVLLDRITGNNSEQQPQQQGGVSSSSVLQHLPKWLSSTRQDLERALARVAAGTAAPAEAVGLWSRLAQVWFACCGFGVGMLAGRHCVTGQSVGWAAAKWCMQQPAHVKHCRKMLMCDMLACPVCAVLFSCPLPCTYR